MQYVFFMVLSQELKLCYFSLKKSKQKQNKTPQYCPNQTQTEDDLELQVPLPPHPGDCRHALPDCLMRRWDQTQGSSQASQALFQLTYRQTSSSQLCCRGEGDGECSCSFMIQEHDECQGDASAKETWVIFLRKEIGEKCYSDG